MAPPRALSESVESLARSIELVAAVRRGSNSDVEFYLRGSPGQQALAYALDQSIGNHELDRVRPQLIARIYPDLTVHLRRSRFAQPEPDNGDQDEVQRRREAHRDNEGEGRQEPSDWTAR